MSVNAETIRPGDWVRFYSNGRLVIGVVQYPVYRYAIAKYVDTDAGAVDVEQIREVRPLPHAIAPCHSPDNTAQSGEIGRNTDVKKQAQNRAEKGDL